MVLLGRETAEVAVKHVRIICIWMQMQSNHHQQHIWKLRSFYWPSAISAAKPTVSKHWQRRQTTTSCARGDTICPRPSPPRVGAPAPRAPPSRRNVAVVSHAQYVLTVTAALASRVKAAVSKAAWWPWPWKWCPSHVWRGLHLCQFWSSYRSLFST